MVKTTDRCEEQSSEAPHLSVAADSFTHPDDVLNSRLSLADKRSLLATWASDARAIPNLPAMRQLDRGAIVSVNVVLAALRELDSSEVSRRTGPRRVDPLRSYLALLSRRRGSSGRSTRDDDDDPPPCPASALPPGFQLALRRTYDAAPLRATA